MDNNTWLVSDQTRLYLITQPEIIEDLSQIPAETKELVLALTKDKDDADLMWFSGIYCTADVRNYNGDGFKYGDLKASANTPKFKPVNWLHRENERIGVIVASDFNDTGENTGQIKVIGVVWQGSPIDRKYADEIKVNYKRGTMGMSMECFGTVVQCSVCEKEFPIQNADRDNPYNHYCEHLKNRRVDNKTTRWIRDPLFVGVGFIPAIMNHKPADDTAWVKEIASLHEDIHDKEVKRMADYTKEQVDELIAAAKAKFESESKEWAETKTEEIEKLKKLKEGLEKKIDELEKAKGESDAEVERLKTEAENKVSAEEIQAVRDELAVVKTEKDISDAKVTKYEEAEEAAQTAKYTERCALLKEKANMTEDQAEALKDHILDDEKFEALKKVIAPEKAGDDKDKTKITFESVHKVQDAATKLREFVRREKE